ncbi:MAG TPA: sugar phosphate isomerase/epimerase family protein [Chloroflexota bacterium]|nr:sugar phosphate isomerase/epimerase family protein [Chloroflexota bacterium]
MPFGVMDAVLRRGPEAAVIAAGELGFDGVEVTLGRDYAANPVWSAEGRRAVKAAARAAGVEVPSVCLGVLNQGGFANDAATRARARDLIKETVEVAADLGAKVILVPFFGEGTIKDERGIEQTIEDAAACAPVAAAAGVVLGLETTLRAAELRRIVSAVDSPAVRVYFDAGNAVWLGYDPAAEVRDLAGLIAQVHIKDTERQPGDRMLGEGRVDFGAVAGALREQGYQGYFVLETTAGGDPAWSARQNLAYIRQLL